LEADVPEGKKVILDLAGIVSELIGNDGPRPEIVRKLPENGLADNVRYLHHYVVLNYHYYLADENILNLAPEVNVAIGSYLRNGENALLLIAAYPDMVSASDARSSFLKNYLPEAYENGVTRLENGKWSGVAIEKNSLAVILEADSEKLTQDLMTEALRAFGKNDCES
jgi:hypothetical protein